MKRHKGLEIIEEVVLPLGQKGVEVLEAMAQLCEQERRENDSSKRDHDHKS